MAYILALSYYQGTILHRIMINLLNNSVGGRYWFSFMLAHGLCRAASFRGNSISEREPTENRTKTFPPTELFSKLIIMRCNMHYGQSV